MKRILTSKKFMAFMLSGILACLFIIPQIIRNSGTFMLFADFNYQQIPFNELANNLIKKGEISYNWFNDIGSSFIGSFSFYNLGSPFFWITLLFPGKFFKYLIGPVFIFKYAFAGLFSFIFLKRYVKNENYAILGSILYSFSGFQITNMLFYHFHDIVALFPLLLIGLDRFIYDNKKGLWGFTVFISALSSYFFFIGEVIFVFLYFIIKLITKEYHITLKNFFILIIETFLGFGMSCLLFVPSIAFTLTNPRTDISWTLGNAILYNLNGYTNIIRAIILPPQVMSETAFIGKTNFASVELYIPLFSCLLYFSYIVKNPKKWISILIIVSIFMMFVPILNSAFTALNPTYYARWFFMPLLIMVLASIKVLEDKISLTPGIIVNGILVFIFTILFFKYKNANVQFIFNRAYAITYVAEYILGILLTIIVFNISNNKIQLSLIFLLVSAFILFNAFMFFFIYANLAPNLDNLRNDLYNAKFSHNLLDNERIDVSESFYYNYGYIAQVPTLKNWTSTVNGNIINFYNSIGINRTIALALTDNDFDARNLLGVKYIITSNSKNDKNKYSENYSLTEENPRYLVFENKNYLKIGTPYKYYIKAEDFMKLQTEERKKVLCSAIVLTDQQIDRYKDFMQNIMEIDFNNINIPNNDSNLIKNKKGFDYEINQEEKSLVLFTIPYEERGWHAEENGKDIPIEIVDSGLMAIPIEKGKHTINFAYSTPGLKYGIFISAISLISYIFYLIIMAYHKNKETSN